MVTQDELLEVFHRVKMALQMAEDILTAIEADDGRYILAPAITELRLQWYRAHNMRGRILVGGINAPNQTCKP